MIQELKSFRFTCDRCNAVLEVHNWVAASMVLRFHSWAEYPRKGSANLKEHYCPGCVLSLKEKKS
jgi:hypothetical protein